MRISQEGANNLSNELETKFKNTYENLTATIANYSNAQNEIWRSNAATLFAGEVNTSIASVDSALTSLNNSINSKLKQIVSLQNTEEEEDITFPTINYTSVTKRVEPDACWAGNTVGVLEGHSLEELKVSFEKIVTDVQADLASMEGIINSNTMLYSSEKESLCSYFAKANTTLTTELENLGESYNNRIKGEEDKRVTAAQAARQILEG